MGKRLNLQDPRAFTEKLQWLKLNWRKDILIRCTDKYEVRKLVAERVGPEILKELYGVYDRLEDIDISQFPDAFVLKINHGSGQNVFCRNKSDFDWKRSSGLLKKHLKSNRYYPHREWGYKNIVPRIICEEHLTKNGEDMYEYQFYCYDGLSRLVQIRQNKAGEIRVSMFDLDLNLLEGNKNLKPLSAPVTKPAQFEKMIEYASKLSRGFLFVRVDLFHVNNRVYFGEMTFYPASGLFPIDPESTDILMGSYLNLPR
ncbi:MAG: ATP-grasp fold amidoligase family protein [Candidatus Omnitrophota bacterium]